MTSGARQAAASQARRERELSFRPMLSRLREQLGVRTPEAIAAAAGLTWDREGACFQFDFFGRGYRVTWPDLLAYACGDDDPCSADVQGLLLTYLDMADGTARAQHWIAFRELPDGWLYHQAFQGYSGDKLASAVGNDVARLGKAADSLGGTSIELADVGYEFSLLPRVHLALLYWLGDDEFACGAQILFDASAGHYLPVDGLAILGGRLVGSLLASAPEKDKECQT